MRQVFFVLLCGLLGGILGATTRATTAGEPRSKSKTAPKGELTAEQQMGLLKSRMQALGLLTDDKSISHVLTGVQPAKQVAYLAYLIRLHESGVVCHCSRQQLISQGFRGIDIANCLSLEPRGSHR
jgi:hypothetical protein